MKYILQCHRFIFCIMLFAISTYCFSQKWNRVLNGENIYCLKFFNEKIAFAGGSNGLILKTTNGGLDWEPQKTGILSSSVNCDFVSFSIVNENILYASTDGLSGTGFQLYKSVDGGSNWNRVVNPVYYGQFRSIHFFDENKGVAVGSNGSTATIFKTSDGGITWTTKLAASGHLMFTSVCFPTPLTGYAVGDRVETSTTPGMIYKTTDGGDTWTQIYKSQLENYSQVYFLDDKTGFVVGGRNALKLGEYIKVSIKKTTNGGQSWTDVISGNGNLLKSIGFIDANNGIAVGHGDSNNGEVYKTTNGGSSWTKVTWNYPAAGISPYKLSMVSTQSNRFWVAGNNGLLINSEDGGTTWGTVSHGSEENITSIFFPTHTTGFATNTRYLLKSTNGGKNWKQIKQIALNNIFFQTETTGFGVSNTGIFKTVDGGNTWISKCNDSFLYSIFFPTSNVGYAGGTQGKIYKTTDGGETWIKIKSSFSINQDIKSIRFITEDTGYILQKGEYSSSGKIFKTTDSGNTWIQQSVGGMGFYFFDADNGIISGSAGGLNITTNGGQNWTSKSTGVGMSIDLFALTFLDEKNGFVVGEAGTIISTTDGCQTWKNEALITNNDLTSIFCLPSKNVLVGGVKGNLLIYNKENISGINNVVKSTSEFNVYPIVAHNEINIRFKNYETNFPIQLYIVDLTGKIVKNVYCQSISTNISIEDLPTGLYLIKNKKSKSYIKFVKK